MFACVSCALWYWLHNRHTCLRVFGVRLYVYRNGLKELRQKGVVALCPYLPFDTANILPFFGTANFCITFLNIDCIIMLCNIFKKRTYYM